MVVCGVLCHIEVLWWLLWAAYLRPAISLIRRAEQQQHGRTEILGLYGVYSTVHVQYLFMYVLYTVDVSTVCAQLLLVCTLLYGYSTLLYPPLLYSTLLYIHLPDLFDNPSVLFLWDPFNPINSH